MDSLPAAHLVVVSTSEESEALRDEYIAARVVSSKWRDDAHHVALATLAKADLIVSWNFKHLVNVERIRGFNAVNMRLGLAAIDIRSPKEVLANEEEGL